MIRLAAIAVVLGGCNAVFGLDPVGRGDAGEDDDDVDAPAPTAAGHVGAFSRDYLEVTGPITGFAVEAEFGTPSTTCDERSRVGGCATVTCGVAASTPRPDAAELVVLGAETVSLVPDDDGNYAAGTGPVRLFAEGQTLQVHAAGAEVPAFDAAVNTPSPVVFVTPMPSPAGPVVPYARMASLMMAWDGVSAGKVAIRITSSASAVAIACEFPTEAGTGTVDQSLMAELPAGPGTLTATVSNSVQHQSGTYAIQITATVVGKANGNDWASGPIVLE